MKGKRFLCGVLTAFTLLTGCAKGTAEDVLGETSISETENEQTKGTLPLEEFFWQTGEYGAFDKFTDGEPIYISDYMGDVMGTADFSYDYESKFSDYYDNVLYTIRCYSIRENGQSSSRLFMDVFDLMGKVRKTKEADFSNLFGDGKITYPNSFQVLSDKEIMITADYRDEEVAVTKHLAIYMDYDFNVLRTVDIFPVVEQMDMVPEPGWAFQGTVIGDNMGNIYVCNDELPIVNVVDEAGMIICTMEVTDAPSVPATFSMMSPEGIPIFEVSDVKNRKNTLFWYDDSVGSMRHMTETNYEMVDSRCMNQYGQIYYLYGREVIRWNAESGAKEKVFNLAENGLGDNLALQKLFVDEEGSFYLLDHTESPSSLFRFTQDKLIDTASITFENLYGLNEYISGCAAEFSRKNPNCNISFNFENDPQQMEPNRTRVMADIMNGKGPDILLVRRSDMLLLQEKDALADLSSCINGDMRDNIFPAILRAGEVDGKLVGLTESFSISTMLVRNDIWSKDSWSIDDVLKLAESESYGSLFIFPWSKNSKSKFLFSRLVSADLEYSPFIDWNEGVCDFDNALFRECVEVCKQYHRDDKPESNYYNMEEIEKEQMKALKEREVLAIETSIGSLYEFSKKMDMAGDDCHYVGFPTEGESGNQFSFGGFLVVNKNSEHYDEIKEFLQFAFSKEKQRKMGTSTVRKDVLESNIIYPDWTDGPEFAIGGGRYEPLASKEDGTPYLEEYYAFIDSCVAEPDQMSGVSDIIDEEIAQYFDVQYDLDKVIDIIESRVQLYLDERS